MVKDHGKTVREFEDALHKFKDAAIKSYIKKILTVLRQHQQYFHELAKNTRSARLDRGCCAEPLQNFQQEVGKESGIANGYKHECRHTRVLLEDISPSQTIHQRPT